MSRRRDPTAAHAVHDARAPMCAREQLQGLANGMLGCTVTTRGLCVRGDWRCLGGPPSVTILSVLSAGGQQHVAAETPYRAASGKATRQQPPTPMAERAAGKRRVQHANRVATLAMAKRRPRARGGGPDAHERRAPQQEVR